MCILIVDDEKDLCELCAESFEMEDLDTETCFSADKALEIFNSRDDIKVIISDDHMPGMSGTELFKTLKEKLGKTQFYLCTGDMEASEEELKKIGMSGVIEKPYDIDSLISRIKSENNL